MRATCTARKGRPLRLTRPSEASVAATARSDSPVARNSRARAAKRLSVRACRAPIETEGWPSPARSMAGQCEGVASGLGRHVLRVRATEPSLKPDAAADSLRPVRVHFDASELRYVNAPRGVTVAKPTFTLDALRARATDPPVFLSQQPKLLDAATRALAVGRAPDAVDAAAATICLLRVNEDTGESDVDDVNEVLLGWIAENGADFALRSMVRCAPLRWRKKSPAGYDRSDLFAWLALARVLSREGDAGYARARRVGAGLRAKTKTGALPNAIAMIFPTESWGTADARSYLKKKSEAELRWHVKAAMLLCANQDRDVARALMRDILADTSGHGTASTALPAYALAYRFGEGIQAQLIDAFLANVREARDNEADRIAAALAGIGTLEVAAALAQRCGKKVGGKAAQRFGARFPQLATAPSSTKARPSGRVAIYGDFQIFKSGSPKGKDAIAAWRACTVNPARFSDWGELRVRSRTRSVGEIIDEWSSRLTVSERGMSLRGVVDQATYSAHLAELIAAFRFDAEAMARDGVYTTGVLLAAVLGADRGIRFRTHDTGESSLVYLDDALDDDDGIREAIDAATPK